MGKKEFQVRWKQAGASNLLQDSLFFGGDGLIKPFKGRLKVLEKLMHQVVDTSANDNSGDVVK